jgi:hypothetical protein
MMDMEPANRTKRFYASTCPVCRELALEAFVTAQVVQYECGCCGGFSITAAAKSTFRKRSEEERKEWLARARQLVSVNGQIALVDAESGPKA